MLRTILLLLSLTGALLAQPATHTIEVRGTGTYKTMPDLAVLTVEATVIAPLFADAVKGLTQKTDGLIIQLQRVGFKKEEIKTTDFSVGRNTVWENNANVDKGFIARQNLTVEFPNAKERLAAIINSFASSENEVRFSFAFTLSPDRDKSVRDELLKRAVADARARAEVIAAAAQQKLGAVNQIIYRSQLPPPFLQTGVMAMAKGAVSDGGGSSGFDVKELQMTDEVTVLWELK